MLFLLDTHVLLWAAYEPERLSDETVGLLESLENELLFSAASIWEVAIKASLGREDFRIDANLLRRELVEHGYRELPVSSAHAAAIATLPTIHRDPFDRMLVAQARVEGLELLTADQIVASYGSPVRLVSGRRERSPGSDPSLHSLAAES